MSDWKQWQGRVVGNLPLTEYLAGTAESGVFLSVTDSQKQAIKLVASDQAADVRLDRWKLAKSLSHPHLLQVYQSGRTTIDGVELLYLATEYADENLSEVISQRALTNDEVREMLPPVLDVLESLHTKGLVHGGVKPGNIMAAGEQLKLSSDDVMRVGDVVSLPTTYDAPEAKQGMSAASDVWSLGLTLVEVLTQQKPVSLETSLKRAVTLPEPFRGIVQNTVQASPASRWNVGEIRQYLSGEKLKAPVKQSVVRQATPKTSKAVFAIGLAIIAVAIAGILLMQHDSQPKTEPEVSAAAPVKVVPSAASGVMPQLKPTASRETPSAVPIRTKSAVREGDGIVDQVVPEVPRKALNTITGTVRVRVRVEVDREGKVIDSELSSVGPSRYFANLAMNAAKQWRFTPSEDETRAWNLQFEFRRSGTNAVPSQVAR